MKFLSVRCCLITMLIATVSVALAATLAKSQSFAPVVDNAGRGFPIHQHAPANHPEGWRQAIVQAPGLGLHGQRDENDPRYRALKKLNSLLGKLSSSAGSENHPAIKHEVESALAEYFDRDMEYRQRELKRLGSRIDEAAAGIQKRQDSRDELIELQLRAFQQDAEGLGLFGAGNETAYLQGRLAVPVVSALQNLSWQKSESGKTLQNERQRIAEARNKLVAATTEPDKAEALAVLRKALGAYFDRDLTLRRQEWEEVRGKLRNLEAKLAKREDAKGEIIGLHLKMLVNEADGLGFFSGGLSPEASIPGTLAPGVPHWPGGDPSLFSPSR